VSETLNFLTQLPFLILISILISIPLWSVVWAVKDAEERGVSGCLIGLLVLLIAWPLGLILWLVTRPAKIPNS
jgi:hypothetical protein